ncbi:MAG: ribonuclease III [bacterium]|nr:ribonuclease III [bacterium]
MKTITELQKQIGYTFKNEERLKEALTHRSYLNENPAWKLPSNERLEFLGDAVLELIVTEELYNYYPDAQEGQMTSLRSALVNYVMLSEIAQGIRLGDYIMLSRGEARDMGRARDVILANGMESLIGAIHLDGGYEAVKKFVKKFVLTRLDEVFKKGLYIDAKSLLQEKAQAELKVTPSYRVIESSGPDHRKLFKIGVYFHDKLIAEGAGQSKQDGEVEAAKKALEIIDK